MRPRSKAIALSISLVIAAGVAGEVVDDSKRSPAGGAAAQVTPDATAQDAPSADAQHSNERVDER
jgi:hypothetical protein